MGCRRQLGTMLGNSMTPFIPLPPLSFSTSEFKVANQVSPRPQFRRRCWDGPLAFRESWSVRLPSVSVHIHDLRLSMLVEPKRRLGAGHGGGWTPHRRLGDMAACGCTRHVGAVHDFLSREHEHETYWRRILSMNMRGWQAGRGASVWRRGRALEVPSFPFICYSRRVGQHLGISPFAPRTVTSLRAPCRICRAPRLLRCKWP